MNIKTEKFEGPLGLLLQLIEKEEMDITEISLSKIADQYIEKIRSNQAIRPEEMADFLVVAAKLLLIKSKALLPYLYPEEKEEIEEFTQQLRMYKEFLDASKKIEKLIGKKKFMFPREFNRQAILASINFFSPPKNITAGNLAEIFAEIISRVKPVEELEERALEKTVNIEEKILAIQQLLVNRIKFNFEHILENAENKTEIIVSFLAMLELIKQRDIIVVQDDLFGTMEINKL